MVKDICGINISGFFDAVNSLSETTRTNTMALQKAGVKTSILNCKFHSKKNGFVYDQTGDGVETVNSYPINLIHVNYDRIGDYFNLMPPSYFKDKYNIGFWAWEFLNPPDITINAIKILDEIWVPSYFCVESLMKVSSKPIVRFLHSIYLEENIISRKDLNLPQEKFIFLSTFDAMSSIQRKNPSGLINAFKLAFGQNSQNVLLVIKTMNLHKFANDRQRLYNQISSSKNIILIDETMDRNQYIGLLKNCDVYISLHRSEGFGLTMAEAMYLGKPTIATGYSGNVDFMNVANSYLVDYDMVQDSHRYINNGEWWAEPDVNDAAAKMNEVYSNYSAALSKGIKASEYIKQNLSSEIIGNQMKSRIETIYKELLPNRNTDVNKNLKILNENFRLKKRITSLEKSIINRFIDGINYILKKLLG